MTSNQIISSVIVVALLQATYMAARGQESDNSLIIPAGTIFEGRIDTRIGSSVSRSGQHFHIVIASPVLANGSTVLIPAGAKVMGEVVEAVPASQVYREKGTAKPKGKLRIQLTVLEMPNGAVFPMVASLAGESLGTKYRRSDNPNLGHGVGYVGSSEGFNAVTPQSHYALSPDRHSIKPELVSRDQMLKNPLYGVNRSQPNGGGYNSQPIYRELRQRGNNIEIENNSPLSMRLDAALRIPVDVITQSVHGGKGLPAALGLDRDNDQFVKHKHKHANDSSSSAPAQSVQEQNLAPMPMPAPSARKAPTKHPASPDAPPVDTDAGF
jgi:hypothetical protein